MGQGPKVYDHPLRMLAGSHFWRGWMPNVALAVLRAGSDYGAFDLLRLDREDLRQRSLAERKTAL